MKPATLLVLLFACSFPTAAQGSEATDELLLQKLKLIETELGELRQENMNIRRESQGQKAHERRLDLSVGLDHMWLLVCGAMVMLMQAGFAMVEAGSCRFKNVQNVLMKNMVDVCVGTMCWYAVGYMFAYGFRPNTEDAFIGVEKYFGHDFGTSDADGNQTLGTDYKDWFFQWAFCATAATIVSGAVAERINMPCYLVYTIAMTGFIYPVVVAWMWSGNSGWLTQPGKDVGGHLNEVGFSDFAGSGIVHMTGGVGALVGAICVGPRMGRFDAANEDEFAPHSLPLVVLGTFILWFGWYGFNCGSTLGISGDGQGQHGALVAMNTTLAASAGGLVVLLLRLVMQKKYDVGGMCNGILAGLVGITAGCGTMDNGWALFSGAMGGVVFQLASSLLKMMKVDDPIDAFAVHGATGAWGVLASAIFDWGAGFDKYNGFAGGTGNTKDWAGNTEGLWVSGFAANIVEILVILAWVGGLSLIVFLPMRLAGILRVSDDVQTKGMDAAKHSPPKAYHGVGGGKAVKTYGQVEVEI